MAFEPASPTRSPLEALAHGLAERRRSHLYRRRVIVDSPQGVEIMVDGESLLTFCSNDYLGLANDPRVAAAFAAGVERYGVGAGASHLVSGHCRAHHELEEALAEFVGAERALVFSTGYMANIGIVTALAGRRATIYEDRLNHASLIDAGRLVRARVVRYPHADVARLESVVGDDSASGLIATDAVFSMDGDLAPLARLQHLAERSGLFLLADDAHGLGALGVGGGGSFEHLGLKLTPQTVLMGTLGKAMGVFGAFAAGNAAIIETLIQQARTYIYTTALPPAVACAIHQSLRIVRDEPWRRERLRSLIQQFRSGAARLGLSLAFSETPIQPVILGPPEAALAASTALRARGLLVPAIRPPTVPRGTARLRITFSAAHESAHVERLLEALAALEPSS